MIYLKTYSYIGNVLSRLKELLIRNDFVFSVGSSFLLSLLIKSSMASFLIFLNKIVEENTTIACKNNRLPNVCNNITTKSLFFMLLWNTAKTKKVFGMQKMENEKRTAFYSEKSMRKNLIKSWLCKKICASFCEGDLQGEFLLMLKAEYTQMRVLFYISLRVRSSTLNLLPNSDCRYQLLYIKTLEANKWIT